MITMEINDILAALWRMDEDQRYEALVEIQGQFCTGCGKAVSSWNCDCGQEE